MLPVVSEHAHDDERLRACNLIKVALDVKASNSDVVDVADALGRKMARPLKAAPEEVLRTDDMP